MSCQVKNEALATPEKLGDTMAQLKSDPNPAVRQSGAALFLRTCAQRYNAVRQFTNTVRMLERITEADSKDAGAYNQLAWIRATCPDASARNGAKAIAAATKACELTKWNNRSFVDTLAAAYAEASAFDKAIEYQERALKIGRPTKAEQDGMRTRLGLYRESRPYRAE
jgi:tetratricopeptide (TPR) repeat protein